MMSKSFGKLSTKNLTRNTYCRNKTCTFANIDNNHNKIVSAYNGKSKKKRFSLFFFYFTHVIFFNLHNGLKNVYVFRGKHYELWGIALNLCTLGKNSRILESNVVSLKNCTYDIFYLAKIFEKKNVFIYSNIDNHYNVCIWNSIFTY